MKLLIKKIIILFLLIIAIDCVLFGVMQKYRPIDYKLFLDSKKEYFKLDYDPDILILGDSHIADSLDTRTLEALTGLNAYNLGVYQASPFETYYLAKEAVKGRRNLSTVILGTNPSMFEKELSAGKYTPLIIGNDFGLIYNSVEGLDKSVLIRSLREKDLVVNVIRRLIGRKYVPTREVKSVYHGHLEFYNQIANVDWNPVGTSDSYSKSREKQKKYFVKTVEYLLKNGINVVIVNSPVWPPELKEIMKTSYYKYFSDTIKDVTRYYGLHYLNEEYDILENQTDKSSFLNADHLNYYGSKIFTKEICSYFNDKTKHPGTLKTSTIYR